MVSLFVASLIVFLFCLQPRKINTFSQPTVTESVRSSSLPMATAPAGRDILTTPTAHFTVTPSSTVASRRESTTSVPENATRIVLSTANYCCVSFDFSRLCRNEFTRSCLLTDLAVRFVGSFIATDYDGNNNFSSEKDKRQFSKFCKSYKIFLGIRRT